MHENVSSFLFVSIKYIYFIINQIMKKVNYEKS